ncbi:hypothetical protein ACLOJK_011904 [Asimina triloba]
MGVEGSVNWKGYQIDKDKHVMVAMPDIAVVSNMINLVTYLHGASFQTYMARFRTILIFGPLGFLGFGLLALQAQLPSLRSPPCDISSQSKCEKVHGYKPAMLNFSIYAVALGEGSLRANLASLGGDQLDEDNPAESQHKSSFFNWFSLSRSWDHSQALKNEYKAAFRKRKLDLPQREEDLHQGVKEEMVDGELLTHTEGFRDKDCPSIASHHLVGYIRQPTDTPTTQFTVEQGSTMNTKMGKLHVSPATLLVFPMMCHMAMIVIYDRLFVPFARRITGHKSGITNLQRARVGFLSTPIAFCIAAMVEKRRKRIAEEHGLTESGTVCCHNTFSFVGLLEFFNREISKEMKSLGTAIFWCASSIICFGQGDTSTSILLVIPL